jgi:hypothetical protein
MSFLPDDWLDRLAQAPRLAWLRRFPHFVGDSDRSDVLYPGANRK